MNADEFRRLGYQVVDWLSDYRQTLSNHPVMAQTTPGELRARIPSGPPDTPEPLEAILADLTQLIVPGLTLWQHPRFFGFFPSNACLASVLGDFISTGLGVIGLSWQASPALTELEETITDWVRQMVGLSSAWHGVIQDTASSCSLVALLCARERATNFALARNGLQGESQQLTVYLSSQSHSSVEKAALLAGFGREQLRRIPTDAHYAMIPDELKLAILADRAAGRLPCAIVATTGTTTTTAMDPLEPIGRIAAEFNIWLHVDAAMAGSAMILPECRHLWHGVEAADSLVFNPHKWLGAVFDCSLYYIRDPEHLIRVMSTNPSYLQSPVDGQVVNYRDWGIPLGRRFRAMKLWFLLRLEGLAALQARLRRDLAYARDFADRVRQTPPWKVLAPVALQTVCIRHEPEGLEGEALDRHTLAWVDRINRSGQAYLTPAMLDGRWMVRVSFGTEATSPADVDQLWRVLQAEVSASPPV